MYVPISLNPCQVLPLPSERRANYASPRGSQNVFYLILPKHSLAVIIPMRFGKLKMLIFLLCSKRAVFEPTKEFAGMEVQFQ